MIVQSTYTGEDSLEYYLEIDQKWKAADAAYFDAKTEAESLRRREELLAIEQIWNNCPWASFLELGPTKVVARDPKYGYPHACSIVPDDYVGKVAMRCILGLELVNTAENVEIYVFPNLVRAINAADMAIQATTDDTRYFGDILLEPASESAEVIKFEDWIAVCFNQSTLM